jgi:mannan endo-1,4-beta-mannosidase
VDSLVPYLRYLEDRGVEVLFRPLHEMNQGSFWWGGRPGPGGTMRLYQITHDRLMKYHGLSNLIWVWDVQDLSRDIAEYNPGPSYWDIMAYDVYNKSGFTQEKYEEVLKVAGDKPIAIGECDRLPSPEVLNSQPRWVFFMGWASLIHERNTPELIRATYDSPRVVTLDKLPGWIKKK